MPLTFNQIKHRVLVILEGVKKKHPSQHARDQVSISRLSNIIDHMIEDNMPEDNIGEILDLIKATSVEMFNQVLMKSRYSTKCRQIHSKYIWRQKLRKAKETR